MRVIRGVTVTAALITLAACATPSRIDSGKLDVEPVASPPYPPEATTEVPSSSTPADFPLEPTTEAKAAPPGFWERIVGGLQFAGCENNPGFDLEARRYLAGGRFAAMLEPMLPRMMFVLEEVERRGLPTEFVLLPIIESHYRLLPAKGNRPAGPWQLMPMTARAHGLVIGQDYDARQDLAAATGAALDHIERLADRFADDWTLVVKAYNAGEFRVRRAYSGANTKARLRGLSPITQAYYAKLHALACILAEPARFDVELPPLRDQPPLRGFPVEADLDLDLAAAAAGVDRRELVLSNPAFRGERAPKGSYLVLPETAAMQLAQGLTPIPPPKRSNWVVRPEAATEWQTLATTVGLDASTLAAINRSTLDADPPRMLVLPADSTSKGTNAGSTSAYVVRAGDSPWKIARRLRVPLADLLELNGLNGRSLLQPGQKLLVP